jgi:hypothetical protein
MHSGWCLLDGFMQIVKGLFNIDGSKVFNVRL